MNQRKIAELDDLHDAVIEQILWKEEQKTRHLQVTFLCEEGCERPDWAGRRVVVTFRDVLLQLSLLLGHTAGTDTLDYCNDSLSGNATRHLQALSSLGISSPRTCVRLALHSGSEIEIVCDGITIEASAV